MKPKSYRLFFRVIAVALFSLSCLAAAQTSASRPPKGPGNIVVRPKFGGQVFGFDIDQNGTEGVLADVKQFNSGKVVSAVETFDLKTGEILNVLNKEENGDNDIVIGIVGTSTAIVEREVVDCSTCFVSKRPYRLISPLDSNKYTGLWKPPHFDKNDIVFGLSRNQGSPMAAFIVLDNIFPGFNNFVFSWDVAKNTFGPEIKMTDPNFEPYLTPVFALDTKTNTAVLAGDAGCVEGCSPDIGLVDLASGEFTHFAGLGDGAANGLAVDSEDGIACTTTANDSNVQFYDLKTKTGFTELLPGATNGRIQSGTDVEYDPIHKLFLVGQPISSTAAEGSSIQVYDPKGNLVESVNGFGSSTLNLSFSYLALLPKQRSGFVNAPPGLRSFTY
jgi:WD40 repeat protein